jgi:hypothetical protein
LTTKTSSFSSRFGRALGALAAVAAAGIAAHAAESPAPIASLSPAPSLTGELALVAQHLDEANPWRGFRDEGPLLWLTRAQRLDAADCGAWARAVEGDRAEGVALPPPATVAAWKDLWKTWEPWRDDDRETVTDCRKFPCGIKFNREETTALNKQPAPARFAKFQALVVERAKRYHASRVRKEYEFAGDPVDPWARFAQAGLRPASVAWPEAPAYYARRVDLDPGEVRVLHQVVDRRGALSKNGLEAVSGLRDVYVDHYFDGWGEGTSATCADPATGKGVTLVQTLLLEFDLLKKTDLISTLSRGTMKNGIEKSGKAYLDRAFARLEKAAAVTRSGKP